VATGDLSDAVGHRNDAEAEGECDAEFGDGRRACGHSANHNGSAADKDQGKRANELGDSFFHVTRTPEKAPCGRARLALYSIQCRWTMSVIGTKQTCSMHLFAALAKGQS
jgi:hypothetical protein